MAHERLEEIRQVRLKKRQALIEAGHVVYPAEARRTHTLSELNRDFEKLTKEESAVLTIGRIIGLRHHGGLIFIDLKDAQAVLQLQLTRDVVGQEMFTSADLIDQGDWIQVTGTLIKTQRGVKTLLLSEFHLLSKSIRPLPDSWFGLKHHETRYRHREADLWLNEDTRQTLMTRSRVTAWLRDYLIKDGYLEVETPILQPIPGGTRAEPFETYHNALNMPLYLRIAPELYLKRLLVGGFEKVFEIARNFRNEGIDRQHNPEFTMLELYWAYADYEDLMDFTEKLFENLTQQLFGKDALEWQGNQLSFAKPFKRVRFIDLFKEKFDVDILTEKNLAVYSEIFKQEKLTVPDQPTYIKLVDELYKEKIRPHLIQPTMIYDYPFEMQPLAKRNQHDPRFSEQFQLLIGGMEVVKAYSEQNDPVEQRERFVEQQQAREAGDKEATPLDENYLEALEYGMPPAAGWGMGIERLIALLTNQAHVRDTIIFPLLKPESHD